MTKICPTCETDKPVSEFWRATRTSDGLQTACKACMRAHRTLPRVRDARKADSRRYVKTERGRAMLKRSQQASVARNREKVSARRAVYRAVKCRRLQRGHCVNCGDPKTQAHHEDYSRKLDVIWLCRGCHEKRHPERRLTAMARAA